VSDPLTTERRPVGSQYGGGLERALVDAALELIEAEGADRLNLREVARQAGVSRAAPAHYFEKKEDLFTTIATGGFELLAHRVMQATPCRPEHDRDRLGTVAMLYAEFADEHPARFES
jgi:AcrR family transcriptional regulator